MSAAENKLNPELIDHEPSELDNEFFRPRQSYWRGDGLLGSKAKRRHVEEGGRRRDGQVPTEFAVDSEFLVLVRF